MPQNREFVNFKWIEQMLFEHNETVDAHEVLISDKIIIDSVNLNDKTVQHHDLSVLIFKNCIFEEVVNVDNKRLTRPLHFSDCIFENPAFFTSSEKILFSGKIEFQSSCSMAMDHDQELTNIVVRDKLDISFFTQCRMSISHLNIEEKERCGEIRLIRGAGALNCQSCKLKCIIFSEVSISDIYIDKSDIANIEFSRAKVNHLLHLSKSIVESFKLTRLTDELNLYKMEDCKIRFADLFLANIKNVLISNTKFAVLHLIGKTAKDCNIQLRRVILDYMDFHQVINTGTISLKEIHIPEAGALMFYECDLGETDFILCDFKKAVFHFENSKMTKIFAAQTDFPTAIDIDCLKYPQEQLVFGQLSTAFQRQGDTARAVECQAREAELTTIS
ncbi:hypothetical protein Q4E93_20705 [Flavitalea sp. BT771]|uniref:hypothetical protein n=1 Tax=Flavitalea sp. BT771 TaxID=3063329 RepID=UPI0026E3AB52|nr:hypothetical protein [Flavitalea sp. BT771]MDO6433041.1 hypothetical protein [Flavitalea sp. BT771]MDV6221683.1 hypothetical protein [Flavitalea sp. BT771]